MAIHAVPFKNDHNANEKLSDLIKLLGIPQKEIAVILGVSERTLERWLSDPKLAEESYRYQMLKEIYKKSCHVIKTNSVGKWLTRPQPELGNYAPLTLMRDMQGFKDILSLLDSMDSGAYA